LKLKHCHEGPDNRSNWTDPIEKRWVSVMYNVYFFKDAAIMQLNRALKSPACWRWWKKPGYRSGFMAILTAMRMVRSSRWEKQKILFSHRYEGRFWLCKETFWRARQAIREYLKTEGIDESAWRSRPGRKTTSPGQNERASSIERSRWDWNPGG